MQIIAELEPTARGPYCGSLGYFGFDGSMDLSILIRTIVAGRGWWQLHVGGGIVADSDPQKEYEETWHKAQGMLQAMEGAGNADEYAVHQGEGEPPFNPGAAAMSYEPIEEGNPIRRIATLFDDADRRLIRTPKTPLPHWPLVSGVFTFPFRTHTLPIWLAMTMVVWLLLGAAFLSYVLLGAARVYDGTESGEFAVAMVGTALLMVGLPALSYLLSAMVLVVQETSQRADQVEDWRDPFGVEWIGSGLLGVFAAAASTAPGVLAGAVFLPEAPALVAAPLAFVLFPVLLLSMLQDGWYCPCSATVLRSLRLAWLGWIAFYAEAAALWAVCGGLCAAIGCVAESWLEFHPALTAAGVSLCVTATLFIYFRLLGRLVWLCNEKAEREEAAEDAAEDETPPDEQ
jgi:hypothetical protein